MSSEDGDVVICRACINECMDYKSIYRQGLILGELTTLASMLSYCTNLDFPEHEDFLPGNLCTGCIQNLVKLYAFRQTVIKSNETLRNEHSELIAGCQEIEEWHHISANEDQQEKQEQDHSYVTLTVIQEDDQAQSIIQLQHDNVVGDDSSQDNEPIEDHQLEEVGESAEEQEVIYHDEELEMEEHLKVEEGDYESDAYEVTIQDAQHSVGATSISTSEIDEDVQSMETKHTSPTISDRVSQAAKRLKLVKPRMKARDRKPVNPDLQCKVCGKQLSNPNSFRYHMQLHSDATPFLCSLCGEGFKTRNAYEGHMSIHDPNNPNTCEICGKSYRQPSSLRTHMLTHTGEKPFQCDICGKGMTQKSGYKKHMLTHTGEKPHTCDICGRDFRYSSNLISHKRHHTGEKPYECPLCEKCFPTSEQLKRHTLVHTGEKPFSCEICSKSFNRRSTLAAHRHTHDNSTEKGNKAEKNALTKGVIKLEGSLQSRVVEHY